MTDYTVQRSRATRPAFFTPPSPKGKKFMRFQAAGVEYALGRDHCLIGDEPGLGKTMQAIGISNAIESQYNLVICPASLRLNWQREIYGWDIFEPSTYPILKAKDGVSTAAHWNIISYDLLRSPPIKAAIMALDWDHLILDEAHYLKDPQGNQRTHALLGKREKDGTFAEGIVSKAERITCLSGTIMPNQPLECYNIARLLDFDAIDRMSLQQFREHFYAESDGFYTYTDPATHRTERRFGKVRNVPRRLRELQAMLRGNFMVRRLKAQVLTQLPAKVYHPVPLVATTEIKKALRNPAWKQVERMIDLDPGAFDTEVPIDGEVSTARRELGEAKAPAVIAYIIDLLDSGVHKLLVGAHHRSVLDLLEQALGRYGSVRVDGRTSPTKRQAHVDTFQTDDGIRVFLGQLKAAGVGLTLHAASNVVFAEADWTPGNNEQFIDRLHRIGQKSSVIGHFPVIPGTLDERIIGRAIEKMRDIHEALDAE